LIAFVVLHPLEGSAIAGAQDIATPKGMQRVVIHDPVLNADAYAVFIPAKWHFQGTLIQGTCGNLVPFPVFRASSPDGLTVLERLPRSDWVWGNSPLINKTATDCLPLKTAMSAQDFLKYISVTLKAEYVGDEPVPQDIVAMANKGLADGRASYAAKYAAAGIPQPVETIQLARAIVRYKNGTFTMKGLLAATVDCTRTESHANPNQPAWVTNSCFADVRYERAPEAQYASAIALLDPHATGAMALQPWVQAWIAANNQQTASNIRGIKARGAAAIAQTNASAEAFNHSQAVRQEMHDDFQSTMQRGTTMSMNQAAQVANANHTAASDWVDYSLDRQTVRDPNTGQVTKVSSANSYTWLDASGKVSYQTNDVNANPNGSLQGTWTRQQVVHGNGSN
jgi:hypothetical protein